MPNEHIPLEDEEQALLFKWAEWASGQHPELSLLYAIPNGGYRQKATAARMKKTGTKPGVPDVHLPVARHGCHGLYIEMKRRKGGNLSADQKRWIEELIRQGYRAVVCMGFDQARETLLAYLKED